MDHDWDAERSKLTDKRRTASDRVAQLDPAAAPSDAEALLAHSSARLKLDVADLEIEAFDTKRAIARNIDSLSAVAAVPARGRDV